MGTATSLLLPLYSGAGACSVSRRGLPRLLDPTNIVSMVYFCAPP